MKTLLKTSNTMLVMLFVIITSCKNTSKEQNLYDLPEASQSFTEEELYRPNFHFTPKVNWINDPNGMFYFNNYYHLYYQHHPDSNVWGPMHWGHAISTDMITWKELPIAIYPDEKGYIFSGSAVVDINNTSGFSKDGKTAVIAMFTYHDMEGEKSGKSDYQTQGIAYSLDEGKTFIKYEGNPVIKNPGIRDFRDPKMIWDATHNKWVVAIAADQKIMFYSSLNLKDWKLESSFGEQLGAHGGVWECPDLFPMEVQGTDETKWVLLVSINPGAPNGGSGTQYFVGDFDGKTFKVDPSFEADLNKSVLKSLWLDYGKDNYAGVTWSNVATADGGKLFIGWMSNWQYANQVPTETWRGAMTIAREVRLQKTDIGYRLISQPASELFNYRSIKYKASDLTIKNDTKIIDSRNMDLSSAEIKFKISSLNDDVYTFNLSNTAGDELKFGYDHKTKQFFIDRAKSGKTDFSDNFSSKLSLAQRASDLSYLSGTILLDKTSIELFFDNGETVMTEIFFPNAPFTNLSIGSNQEFVLETIEANQLNFN